MIAPITLSLLALAAGANALAVNTSISANVSTPSANASSANSSATFGKHYAVLQLDYVSFIVAGARNGTVGAAFLNSTTTWSNAVHKAQVPSSNASTYANPLIIYSQLAFPGYSAPYLGLDPTSPFATGVVGSANVSIHNNNTALVPEAGAQPGDYIVRKTRYDATYANQLIDVLANAKIDTVVLSGIRSSGVILSTAYTLFDLGYKVYVVSNCTFDAVPTTQAAILGAGGILEALPVAGVLTLEAAKKML